MPENLNHKLNYIGAWHEHGIITIEGDAGEYSGYGMAGLGHLILHSSAGDHAGSHMKDFASLEIEDDSGDYTGGYSFGEATVIVRGSVGDYCGYRMNSPGVSIEVGGDDAGRGIALEAVDGESLLKERPRALRREVPRFTLKAP